MRRPPHSSRTPLCQAVSRDGLLLSGTQLLSGRKPKADDHHAPQRRYCLKGGQPYVVKLQGNLACARRSRTVEWSDLLLLRLLRRPIRRMRSFGDFP